MVRAPPTAAGERENIAELWPLLEGMIPHLARSTQRGVGGGAIERYVQMEVARDPLERYGSTACFVSEK